jgi:hypothetical protein
VRTLLSHRVQSCGPRHLALSVTGDEGDQDSLDDITGTKLWLPEGVAARDSGSLLATAVHIVDPIADV